MRRSQDKRVSADLQSSGGSPAMVSPQSTWEEVEGSLEDCLARAPPAPPHAPKPKTSPAAAGPGRGCGAQRQARRA
jgi:hypothetical protein